MNKRFEAEHACPGSRRRTLIAAAMAAAASSVVGAQTNKPEDAALALKRKAFDDLNARLSAANARLSAAQAALNQLEVKGPQTSAIDDRVSGLKVSGPQQIAVFRARLKKLITDEDAKIRLEHQQALEKLAKAQADDDAKYAQDAAARKKFFQRLLMDGSATTKALESARDGAVDAAQDARDKKESVMDELRSGFFCSECSRSKSEIEEQDDISFEAHLVKVSGSAVMLPAKLKEREDGFDSRIQTLEARAVAAQAKLDTAWDRHRKDVETSRNKELGEMEVARGESAKRNQADRTAAEGNAKNRLAQLASESQALEAEIAAKEVELAALIKRLENESAANAENFRKQRASLTSSVASLRSERAALLASTRAAHQAYAESQRGGTDVVDRASVMQDVADRQNRNRLRKSWLDDAHDYTVAQARNARARLDGMDAGPAVGAAQRAKAEQSAREYAQATEAFDASGAEPSGVQAVLTARAEAFMHSLPQNVQDSIRAGVEQFSTPTNTARAVIRNSIGSFESSIRDSMVDKALGSKRSLAQDLAAAMTAAEPDLGATLKANAMPVLEESAVELAVVARSAQEGREFTGQELTVERGFARTRLMGADLKKHFNGLLRTLNETMDNAVTMIGMD